MTQPNVENSRFTQMAIAHVICVAVSAQHLLWCASPGGAVALYTFVFRADGPYTMQLVELEFMPAHISLFEDKILVVGETAVALFVMEQPLFSAIVAQDDVEESEGESIIITEELFCSGVFSGANQIAWSSDGTAVALSCTEKLFMVDCRIGFQSTSCGEAENTRCLMLDCSNFYGEPGAAFAAFGANRLFLLSLQNHLVMTRYSNIDDNIFCGVKPQLERDGHIISRAHHVTCFVAGCGEEGHLVVGLSDGTLMLLQQETLEVFLRLNVTNHLARISNRPLSGSERDVGNVGVLNVAVGCRFMLVVRPDAVVCYDKKSMDLLQEHTTFLFGDVPLASACSGDGSWCVWFPQKEELLYYAAAGGQAIEWACTADDVVHAQTPLPSSLLEPLRLPFQERESATCAEKGTKKKNNKKQIVEKPVTFGHPIKSSGYASDVPWSVLKQKQQRVKQIRGKAQNGKRFLPVIATRLQYKALRFSTHPLQLMSTANKALLSLPIHSAMIAETVFSADGRALLTASADNRAHWLKYPVEKYKAAGTLMVAHKGPVNTIDVSLSANMPIVATGSSDGVIAVWQPQKREAPYITQSVCKSVRKVKFFYTDKFLCYAAGNSISLCRYALDNSSDDLHLMRNESRMETMFEFSADMAKSVASFDCINYFTSNLILWAGSNKSVGIYDIAATQSIQMIEEAHSRPIHRVAMMTAGRYASLSSNLLHVYMTAGLDNAVRLWDLRQRRAVRQLSLHRNSATFVGVAFSPNGTAVAVGSETRAVFLYDVGTGSILDNVAINDTPTALCWHPLQGILAVGTAAGAVQLMQQRQM